MTEKERQKEFEAASVLEGPLEAECVEFDLSSAPDGGFGWVVVFAAFCVQFIVLGVMNNFGVIFSELLVEFKRSKSQTGKFSSLYAKGSRQRLEKGTSQRKAQANELC